MTAKIHQMPGGDYFVKVILRNGKKIYVGPGVSKRDAVVISRWLKKAWRELRAIALRSVTRKV